MKPLTPEEAVQEYQCPGCASGPFPECFKATSLQDCACSKHCAGTMITSIGLVFLGLPKGFNRIGPCEETKISIFKVEEDGWGYGKYNVPVWKYFDKFGSMIIRGKSPRTNYLWIHIFLAPGEDWVDCYEVTDEDMEYMD